MKRSCFILLLFLSMHSSAQVIPDSMRTNWNYAGIKNWQLDTNNVANVKNFGAMGDGTTNDYTSIVNTINSLSGHSGIVFFPAGNYLINSTINLPDSVTLKGEGASLTTLTFNLGGVTGNCINLQRGQSNFFTKVDSGYARGSSSMLLTDASVFNKGDYAEIRENNGAWDTQPASWAAYSVGQIVQIDSVSGNTIFIKHPLRIDYDSTLNVEIQKINPIANTGLSCFKITRVDSTAPSVNYMVYFNYAVNCKMTGVESDHSLGAHVWAEASTSLDITGCYFHHAYIYDGTSTNGYGVGMAVHTGECKIENNIFKHLRHSMIAKQGANGNVYSYNYSTDPNRTEFPPDAGADICLHGHYAFANLFEGNICQTLLIDSTWGPSGPFNTFFRNRIELYGLLMSSGRVSSNKENFVGNDITNTSFLHGFYILSGTNNFTYGNNVLGTINPPGTSVLPDSTYYLSSKPVFWNISKQWPDIGTPNDTANETNPARERYLSGIDFTLCDIPLTTSIKTNTNENVSYKTTSYPNPFSDQLNILCISEKNESADIVIQDVEGRLISQMHFQIDIGSNKLHFETTDLGEGLYFVTFRNDVLSKTFKCVKIDY